MYTLQELYKAGSIELLHRRGLLSSDVLRYFDYNDLYQKERDKGRSYRDAILMTAIQFDVSESTVKRAVRAVGS